MNRNRNVGLMLVLTALLCAPACRTLDPTGVYAGDQFLYESELAIVTSYDVVKTFLTWEKANRATLGKWPEIRKAADRLRLDYKRWHDSALALHDVYAAQPTAENRNNLSTAVALLRTALAESQKYMSLASAPSTP